MRSFITPLLASLLLFATSSSHAQINMGMAGDSLTDDYLGGSAQINNNLAAGSWGQILKATRGSDFNFGGYQSVNDGTWDTIRYSGDEYNWATSGGVASENTMSNITGLGPIPVTTFGASYLNSQVAGLAGHISSGDVSTAYVGIGSNDFFYHTNVFDFQGNISPNPDAIIDQTFIDDIAGSILAGVDTLLAAGSVELLVGLLPAGTAGGSNPEILAGIDAVNQLLVTGIDARAADGASIATVDLWSWTTDGNRVDADGNVTIGSLIVEFGTVATTDEIDGSGDGVFCNTDNECPFDSHASKYSAEDGIHPNTAIQALLANEMIDALNTNFDHDINLISDGEILQLVGVSEVPVPAAIWLFGSALISLAGLKRGSRAA